MPTDPSRLHRHLPDVYSADPASDQYKIEAAVAKALADLDAKVADARDDRFADSADGLGLDRKGANLSIPRTPGMSDAQYRQLLQTMAGLRRGTLGAIRAVWDVATGQATAIILDRQIDLTLYSGLLGIPSFEVWIWVPAPTPSYGRGAYAGFSANYDGRPYESAIAGQAIAQTGHYGGLYNDHVWSPVDWFTRKLIDMVRPAGVDIIYREVS